MHDETDDAGFYEYDVPGAGGGADAIERWLEERRFKAQHLPRRVLFFDEAHGLTKDAASSLLKKIEEAPHDVVYIFATSEHHNLSAALRSRLVPLKVRPLGQGQAATLLRNAAKNRKLEYDDEALVMLTAMVARQPRDLLNALDQVVVYGERITTGTLRRVFDLEYLDALQRYLLALGRQDRAELNRIIAMWRDAGEEKQRWVLAVLAGMYTVDILGIAADVDPIVEHLAQGRRQALQELRERLGVVSDFELAPYWRQLLGHWRSELVGAYDATIEAQFVAFHEVVAGMGAPAVLLEGGEATDADTAQVASKSWEAGFLGIEDVRKVLDLSSYLTQEYGLHFNALFVVTPAGDAGEWHEQAGLASGFCAALEREVTRMGTNAFAAMWTIEGTDDGIQTRVAAHIPEFIGVDALDGLQSLRLWRRRWANEHPEAQATLTTRRQKEKPAAFHWNVVRDMLDALNPSLKVRDFATLGRNAPASCSPSEPLRAISIVATCTHHSRLASSCRPRGYGKDGRRWPTLSRVFRLSVFLVSSLSVLNESRKSLPWQQ
ncbi:MAG: hypothetical protein ABS35_32200 [Kaistia sp. SCN 65-12]|nr:MAG: hypothetical protein ABS35_32200 [Kaistia sp. SCN 65-12]